MRSQSDLIRLYETLVERFNLEELRMLGFYLKIDYDELKGEGKSGKARDLVISLARHGRIGELVAEGKRLRPGAAWDVDDTAILPLASSPLSIFHEQEATHSILQPSLVFNVPY